MNKFYKALAIGGLATILGGEVAEIAYAPTIDPHSQDKVSGIEKVVSPEVSPEMKKLRFEFLMDERRQQVEHQNQYNRFMKTDFRTNDFEKDKDYVLLARLLLGEAEDCSTIEKVAISYTVINREKSPGYADTLKGVILAPWQYSAFNSDRNAKLKNPMGYNPQEFVSDLFLAQDILSGVYEDPTDGATNYINLDSPEVKGRLPQWVYEMERIGKISGSIHDFYKPATLAMK